MKKIVVCAMIFAISLCCQATSFAQADSAQSRRGMMGRHCISRWEMMKFMRDLNITDEQETAFEALKDATETNAETLLTQMKDLQEQKSTIYFAAEIDTAAAETLIEDMLALQNQLADIMLHAELEAVQILTADQRALILEMINKLKECGASMHDWKNANKSACFSLIMPDKAFLK